MTGLGPPPILERWAARLLSRAPDADAALGDLAEGHAQHRERRGRRMAALWYARQVLSLLRHRRGLSGAPSERQPFGSGGRVGLGLRQAVRSLARRPGYPAVAVLTLALAVGASATVFAAVEAALLQPLPFPAADRTVVAWRMTPAGERRALTGAETAEFAARNSGVAGWAYLLGTAEAAFLADGQAVPVVTNTVSGNLFQLLGVEAHRGRLISRTEALAGDADPPPPAPVLLDHAFWIRQFGGDPAVLGRTIHLDGQAAVVVGVLPEGFGLPLPATAGMNATADVWRPLREEMAALARPERMRDQDSDDRGMALAVLEEGRTVPRVEAALNGAAGASMPGEGAVRLTPLRADALAAARPLVRLLGASIGMILLLASANMAGLLVARTAGRQRELAMRMALGASRLQLAGPVLAEGLLIGGLASILGLVLASWGVPALAAFWPAALPLPAELRAGGAVLAFGSLAALVAGLAAAALPAWWSGRADALVALRSAGTVGLDRRVLRLRDAFVAAQLALAVTLLACTGLLVRTFDGLAAVEPGFHAAGVATFDIGLVYRDGYRGPADRAAFVRALEERLLALPAVRQVGVIAGAPLRGESFIQPWGRAGEPPTAWSGEAEYRVVSQGYFPAMGTRLVAGRNFTPADDRQDRRVVLVDQALARRLEPAGAVLGHRLALPVDGDAVEAEIVGVVESVRFVDLTAAGPPAIYVPYRHEASRRITVVLRTGGDPAALAAPVRAALRDLDPRLPLFAFRTMDEHVAAATAGPRFALVMLAMLALVAALVAAAGTYALVAFTTARRASEFGLRRLLGASPGSIGMLVLLPALRLAGMALAAGVLGALGVGWLMRGLLFEVSVADPGTYAVVAGLLLLTVGAATLAPALRAARAAPAVALRSD
ncbi:MAG: ABC transporter permease [Gemmatimonadota bacterium]